MTNLNIISTGHYVPKKAVSNYDLEKIIDTSDEWIFTRTGIKCRHISDNLTDENTSHLAFGAVKNAIDKVGYDVNKIDLIIVATLTPDHKSPSVANMIQAMLGISHRDIPCFDINAACTGFIYALNIAGDMLSTGKYRSALVVGAEVLSKVIDYTDRNTCVLFGDGAGAVILESTDEQKPAHFYSVSQGELDKTLVIDQHIHMDGKKVYQFAINAIEKAITQILDKTQLTLDDISVIIPHQANIRIIQSVAKTLGLPIDKFFLNIHEYGNTSAASIAIALDEYLSNSSTKQGDKVLLVGFGGGFTYGAGLLTL